MIPPLRLLLAQTSALIAYRGILPRTTAVRCLFSAAKDLEIQRLSAFCYKDQGGNPAGVAFCDSEMPPAKEMMEIAAQVGYSETAFLTSKSSQHGWRVRYFAPETEVPFCGHATIALGAALGQKHGANTYNLELNHGKEITVTAEQGPQGEWWATLRSPPTFTQEMPHEVIAQILTEFGLSKPDLDPKLAMKYANGGSLHVIVGLKSRETLANMEYHFESVKALMQQHDILTINLVQAESDTVFHARNAFAIGGVVEDPATGSAAAALSGYLRDIGWANTPGKIEIYQGFDMGVPSHLTVESTNQKGGPVLVSGRTRPI